MRDRLEVFRLRKQFHINQSAFSEAISEMPMFAYINDVSTLNAKYLNPFGVKKIDLDVNELYNQGHAYVNNLTTKSLLEYNVRVTRQFERMGDRNTYCEFFQYFPVNGQMKWLPSIKVFLSDKEYLTICHGMDQLGHIGRFVQDILDSSFIDRDGWQMYLSLSRREKEVLRLLAEGHSSKQIADELFISKFTVDTHRKNIFKKLNTNNQSVLFKMSQAFDLACLTKP